MKLGTPTRSTRRLRCLETLQHHAIHGELPDLVLRSSHGGPGASWPVVLRAITTTVPSSAHNDATAAAPRVWNLGGSDWMVVRSTTRSNDDLTGWVVREDRLRRGAPSSPDGDVELRRSLTVRHQTPSSRGPAPQPAQHHHHKRTRRRRPFPGRLLQRASATSPPTALSVHRGPTAPQRPRPRLRHTAPRTSPAADQTRSISPRPTASRPRR